MKRPWLMIVAWLLLLLPTLGTGLWAYRQVAEQQSELATSTVRATEVRAQNIAETMALTIDDVKQALLDTLATMDESNPAEELAEWKRRHPLVRNVFVWHQDLGLVMPSPDQLASDEEVRFVNQFKPLFDGDAAWYGPSSDRRIEPANNRYDFAQSVQGNRSRLREWAVKSRFEKATADAAPAEATAESGWIPWFTDNQLSLLGWRATDSGRYGFELEVVALVSRLLENLPADPPEGQVYALRDGQSRIVHQTGGDMVEESTPMLAATPIGIALPHWTIAVYQTDPDLLQAGTGGLQILGLLLIGGVMACVVFGGSLLLWQAYRSGQDASRKTTFVSNVSHELKTPLTTIRMYAELMSEGRVTDKDKQRSYLRTIVTESQRLTRLVNNVLDFSRLEQGKKNYHLEVLDLCHLVPEVLATQQMRLEDAAMTCDLAIPDRSCRVLADRDTMEQVVLNLVDNAIKYAADGKQLVCSLQCDDRLCRIRVEDAGPGIPPHHRKQIFEKFHRVDDSLTSRQPGSGLGLSIARQLVSDMGGSLTCSDRAEGGTCFCIELPTHSEEVAR